ncbi:response regulator [bacterium]|nr:response regulator [bacterium]
MPQKWQMTVGGRWLANTCTFLKCKRGKGALMASANIVIVDEEEELRENLQDLLEFQGYTVFPFNTGEELLDALPAIDADLFLLDYQLPGINGIDLYSEIKQIKPGIPGILVTASSLHEIIEKSKQAGLKEIIQKPYALADMIDKVKSAL